GFNTIQALLVHPAEPTTIYISVVELNSFPAVYKSTDRGQTFAKLSLSTTTDLVMTLSGDPSNASTVYAGSINGLLYKTSDEGATWSPGLNLAATVKALVIDPTNRQNVYAGTESDYYYFAFGQFQKSVDQGNTFTTHSPGQFQTVNALAIDPHLP